MCGVVEPVEPMGSHPARSMARCLSRAVEYNFQGVSRTYPGRRFVFFHKKFIVHIVYTVSTFWMGNKE